MPDADHGTARLLEIHDPVPVRSQGIPVHGPRESELVVQVRGWRVDRAVRVADHQLVVQPVCRLPHEPQPHGPVRAKEVRRHGPIGQSRIESRQQPIADRRHFAFANLDLASFAELIPPPEVEELDRVPVIRVAVELHEVLDFGREGMAREYQPRPFDVEIVPVADHARYPGLVGPRFFIAAESGMTHLNPRVRLQFEGLRSRVGVSEVQPFVVADLGRLWAARRPADRRIPPRRARRRAPVPHRLRLGQRVRQQDHVLGQSGDGRSEEGRQPCQHWQQPRDAQLSPAMCWQVAITSVRASYNGHLVSWSERE